MSWENTNNLSEEAKARLSPDNQTDQHIADNEQNKNEVIELRKFQDPAKNPQRQAYLNLLKQFGEYLETDDIQEMVRTILTDDCQFFIFSSTEKAQSQHCLQPQDLHNLYKGFQIKERRVRETYVDTEKTAAVQLCNFKTLYEGNDNPVDEVVAEVFTFKDKKISKYRMFIGEMAPAHGQADPFASSTKSKSLEKVKEINYAMSDEPDLEKVASLLHENAEYKVWSWDSPQKILTFTKQDFAKRFRQELEENYVIKRIVPYELFTEARFVYGRYVYHLEGKSRENKNKKFVWLSTCVYSFDKDLNIIKVTQQGELYPEGEVTIPFNSYSRETLLLTIEKLTRDIKPNADVFYDDLADFNCMSYHFAPEGMPHIGVSRGLDNINLVIAESKKGNLTVSQLKAIDLFVDSQGSSYDVVVSIPWCIGKFTYPGFKYSGVEANLIPFCIYSLENGKLVRSFSILATVPESIPPPFENLYPEGTNLISRGVNTS